jgi:hypothetical protein
MQCTNHLKQVALACQNYHDTHQKLPTGGTGTNPNWNSPGANWGLFYKIAPYMEQQANYDALVEAEKLYRAANLWATDSVPSYAAPAADSSIAIVARAQIAPLLCPSDAFAASKNDTDNGRVNYRICSGDLGVNNGNKGIQNTRGTFGITAYYSMAAVTDGTSNTIGFSEKCVSDDQTAPGKVKRVAAMIGHL